MRALRLERKVSQRHLADASGVPQPFISRLENGTADATWRTREKLYAALGCQAVIVPLPTSEDALDLIDDERLERADRAEAGRLKRWG